MERHRQIHTFMNLNYITFTGRISYKNFPHVRLSVGIPAKSPVKDDAQVLRSRDRFHLFVMVDTYRI